MSTQGVPGGPRRPRLDDDFPVLTDGVIVLKCLSREDAAQHLAGEDDDQIRWLSGGPGSMQRLPYWIDSNREQWKRVARGAISVFGMRTPTNSSATWRRICGSTVWHLAKSISPMPYFPAGADAASRIEWCCWSAIGCGADSFYVTAVVRVAPDNIHSHKVPRDAGFVEIGAVESPDGDYLVHYEKSLKSLLR